MEPLRVVVLGDPHTGSNGMGLVDLRHVVDRVNALAPGLILLVGDYINHRGGGVFVPPEKTAGELGRLRSTHGVFSVLGNHDWRFDGARVRMALETNGIPVLEDSSVRVDGGGFQIMGFADDSTRGVNPQAAQADLVQNMPVLGMGHDPVSFEHISSNVVIYFAGHTHGGQVNLPIFGPVWMPGRTPKRYVAGLIEEGNRRMYVTSGLGESILPVRFLARPEIAVVTIRGTAS
jgi:predicted MPP superfamily phosphohydrolase